MHLIQFSIQNFNAVFLFKIIYKSALHIAAEKENVAIVKLLLEQEGIDVNDRAILN